MYVCAYTRGLIKNYYNYGNAFEAYSYIVLCSTCLVLSAEDT